MKKTLLSLAMLLIGVGAWAQNYIFSSTAATSLEEGKYVIWGKNSNNPSGGFINGSRTIVSTSYNDGDVVEADYIWTLTKNNDENGTFTLQNASTSYYFVAVGDRGNAWGTMTGNETANLQSTAVTVEGTSYFVLNQTNYTFSKTGADLGKTSYIHTNSASLSWWANYSETFTGSDVKFLFYPLTEASQLEELTALFNSFDYQMAYKCLGDAPGQFSGDGDAYKTAYEAAEDAIDSGEGDFETLSSNLEEAFGNLEYNALETGKYYTIKTKSSERYFATTGRGSTPAVSDDIFIFKLDSNNGLVIYTDNQRYINGLIHARNAGYFSRNKFYYVEDEGMLIHYNEQNFYKVGNSGTLEVVQDIADIDEACYWVIEEVAPTMAINSDVKYATFYAPVAVTIPDDVSAAYYVSATTANSASLTALEGTIPANTGVVLYAEAGFSGAPAIVDYVAPTEGNLLSGTTTQETINKESGYSYYVLAAPASEGGVVGFYNAVNGGDNTTFVNAANKAYLKVAAEASARFLNFDFGTETAIESIQGAENGAVIYDLAGRRVQNAQKGLYIVNGKKVIK